MNAIEWFRRGGVATRTRLVLLAGMMVVGAGVAVALGALWLDPAKASVGPLPAQALLLPADARFVMGIDVRRFTASPFYERFGKQKEMRPEALRELERKTGIDPARDVDQIVVAGSGTARESGLALVLGRFELSRLGRTLETEGKVRAYTHEGVTVYAFREQAPEVTAVAFLGADALLFGPKTRVEAAVSSRTRGEAPLRDNATLLGLVAKVRPGSTFWMVGDQALLAGLPGSLSGPAGAAAGAPAFNLPALRSLIVTGDLEPQVALAITGEAADEPAARSLADLVRGLMAMATLQAQQKPELQQLATAVTVATEANRVIVSARIPYALLDSLQSMSRPAAPSATRPPAESPKPPAAPAKPPAEAGRPPSD